MISDDLYALADKLSVYALAGIPLPASTCACMAQALMDHARTAAVMETVPISVTEVPTAGNWLTYAQEPLVRAVKESTERPWPTDLGGTQEQ